MAKELPYFKFEPGEWDNGNIQLCSRESKGLFIDLAAVYWQRLGDLSERYVINKLCNGNASALQELLNENIIKVSDGVIVISFLDAQLEDFKVKSEKSKKAAEARWSKPPKIRRVDADALQAQSEGNAIREEEKREEKRREEEKRKEEKKKVCVPEFSEFLEYALSKKPKASREDVRLKYEAWKEAGWKKEIKGKFYDIKNWKSTLLQTLPYIKEVETYKPKLVR